MANRWAPGTMRRFFIPVIATSVIVLIALRNGWDSYQSAPAGVLLYTPIGPCPKLQNSFVFSFQLSLLAGGIVVLLVAGGIWMASMLPKFHAGSKAFRGALRSIGIVLIALVVASLFSSILATYFPTQVKPECQRQALS